MNVRSAALSKLPALTLALLLGIFVREPRRFILSSAWRSSRGPTPGSSP